MKAEKMQKVETVFHDGNAYFSSLLKDIDSSTYSIELESYIFQYKNIGKQLVTHLIAATKRNVQVRILVDGAGTPNWSGKWVRQMEQSGIQTRIYHPFPWRLWQWSRTVVKLPSLLKAIYLLLKINTRNHRKTCVIDQNIAYVGSLNISDKHLSTQTGGENWRDTGVKLTGYDLSDLQNAFESIWDHTTLKQRVSNLFSHINTQNKIRLNNTRHRRRVLYKNLLKRIARAKQKIWITNAYFIPDNFLMQKLCDAAECGLDVKILLPRHSDTLVMPWASKAFYAKLLHSGVKIFEYLPSILHAKTMIIDHWTLIGSSNLNHRSLLHDLEIDVVIEQPTSINHIAQQYTQDLTQSNEVTLMSLQQRPWYQKLIGRVVLYLKYWI